MNFFYSDDGGIYKNRTNHRDRAREIDDTHDTKIDLPVGYREVETVDEEDLYRNAGVCYLQQKKKNFSK